MIQDEIIARKEHEINIYFHFAERCIVRRLSDNLFFIDVGVGTVDLQMDSSLQVETFRGCENPIAGWVSRGYHQKQPSTTLVGHCTASGRIRLTSRIHINRGDNGS